ncbi:hypothetical protein L6164_036242 [Bauhinia variegata]|uniref:Uncharacterized protein n=1 Tax=Bauhinia variegata TaxID=167791 RepID=A0ACB9KGJ2_BAUVA|nr:hypothetical protein L6164_036242 [Bauhinia variegata]
MYMAETPLWRHGPPEKPVLCNACGSRYRVRGNLDDYVPNHSKFLMINAHEQTAPSYSYNTRKRSNLNGNGNDTSSNVATSSSSSKSTSESAYQGYTFSLYIFLHYICTDQWLLVKILGIDTSSWKNSIPSRKRSRLVKYRETELSMKKFHKQLLSLWEIQKAENAQSYDEEEVLVYKQSRIVPSNEIGLGCALLHPADQTNNNDSHDHHP